MQLTKREQDILNRIEQLIFKGELTNAFLVQNIELSGRYLNLKTRSDYANENNKSYNGVKNCRKNIRLFNVNFIIDNE